MLPELIRRELRARFIGSSAGWLWLLVNPLLLLGVYSVVFGLIFDARVPADLGVGFVSWLAVGLWPWLAFSDAILRASESIPEHAALISKVPMQRELLPLASAIAAFLLQLAGYLFVQFLLAVLGTPIHLSGLFTLAVTLTVLLLLAAGLGLIASALRVYLPDIKHLLPTLLMLWFFLTPILYAPEVLPAELASLIALNPVAGLIDELRAGVFEGRAVPGTGVWIMLVVAAVVFAAGRLLFRRLSPFFEDFL